MIEIVNLTKAFEGKAALDNISVEIKEGRIYGLVGSNGSGKSTLLRLISGVYTPDNGMLAVDGCSVVNNPEKKAEICFLPDTPYFIHQANINEMVKFYKLMYPTFNMERFKYLTSIFPLDTKAKISTMSKGMQRQAALMLALSTEPKYLLLDEAFDGLDPVMRKVLKSLLADGVTQGMTVIISSHNLRDLDDFCDIVGLLHKGKILFSDEIDSIKSNVHKIQVVFDKTPDISVFDELDVLKTEKSGSVVQMVVRGEQQEILNYINKFFPLFIEVIPPTFEEIFIYELEEIGYDAKNILE